MEIHRPAINKEQTKNFTIVLRLENLPTKSNFTRYINVKC